MESRKSNQKVRYAVVGAGNIAQVAVLPAFAHAKENSELVALISSDPTKRAELCKKYDVTLHGDYADFEQLLARGRVDAVYIATPNASHKEFTLRAAAAGVHVLCEKPMADTWQDAKEMASACQYAGVKLMIAYRLQFEAATLSAYELLSQGKIGDPMAFQGVLTHVVRPGDIRTQAAQGGGALLDLGVYCINAARHVFRAEPIAAWATVVEQDGTDDTTCGVLRFSRNRIAQFLVSNSTVSNSSFKVLGTHGELRVEPAFEYAVGLEHHLTVDDETTHEVFSKRDQFAPQLIHFSQCILDNEEPKPSAEEGLRDLRVVEALFESAASGQIIRLEPLTYNYHPTPAQEMRKPPISKPNPVHAPSPSLR